MATYVSRNLISVRVTPSVAPGNIECLFVDIMFHVNKRLIIGNIIGFPLVHLTLHSIFCLPLTLKRHNEMIILGDFNSNWLNHSSPNDRNLFSSANLTQLINDQLELIMAHH